jgi:tetratricopeptide (TPR) repeat protein
LWDLPTNQAADGADTLEAIEVLERAIAQVEDSGAEPHPALLHIYIHVMEMSPYPERALRAADILRELVPDAGHLKHMPSHVDILCGDYYNAVVANKHAIEVDNIFAAREGDLNEYTFYRAHNIHFKIYAAMLLGQFQTAMEAVNEMTALAHEDMLRLERPPMADHLEGMLSMKVHVLIRFGKWHEILNEAFPEDKILYCNTTAMLHYARTIALATLHRFDEADAEREAFRIAAAKVPEERFIFNNTCVDILKVADAMMNGELEYHKGNHELAFEQLRHAVYLDDNLKYAEPWGWMMPSRHALGALLLEQERIDEAYKVYRADLGLDNSIYRPMQHPNNVWSLHGYVTCLEKLAKDDEATVMRARLNQALARADVEISASCFCAVGHDHNHHCH